MALEIVLKCVLNCCVFDEATHICHISHPSVGAGNSCLVRIYFPLFICSVSKSPQRPQLSVTAVQHNVIPFSFAVTPRRLTHPAAVGGAREAQQGPTGLSVAEEGRRAPVFPLHQALPGLHPQLRRETSPPQGERVFTLKAQRVGFSDI